MNKTVVWEWQRSKQISTCELSGFVNSVRFNPMDASQISTSGPNHLRMWRIQADVLKPYPPFGGVRTSDTNFMVSFRFLRKELLINECDVSISVLGVSLSLMNGRTKIE